MRFKCSYRPHKLWYRHKTMKIRRTTEKHHYMKMNLMLRQWTDSALWKNPSIGYQSQGINSLPAVSNAYSTDSVMGCQPICLTPMRCTQILPIYTWPISTCDETEDLFWSGLIWSFIFWRTYTQFFDLSKYQCVQILFLVQKMRLIQMLIVPLMAQGQRNLL